MTYLIPTIGKLILLVFCTSLVIQTLSRLGKIADLVKALSKEDQELLACAQRKANLLNIDDAYNYLQSQVKKEVDELVNLKDQLKSNILIHEESCFHPLFPSLHASAHYQKNPNYPRHWPNWILGIGAAF